MTDFSKFDKMVDLNGLKGEIGEIAKNGGTGTAREVPHGQYEVKVEKMELRESKKGDPMVTIWFRILSGEYKRSMIFLNQVITRGFQIDIVNQLLTAMDSGLTIEFESYSQYGQLLMDVMEAIDGKLEYALDYVENNKGYSTFRITEVFDAA